MGLGLVLSFGLGRWLAPSGRILPPWRELKPYLPVLAVESFGGSLLYLVAFSRAPIVVAATLTSLAPVLAVPAAWALGLERFSVRRTLGVALVVLGLVLLVVFRASPGG
jgi:drug/metabolite transporter (DMT)-like permease